MTTAPSAAPDTTDPTETPEPKNGFDRFFEITRRGSNIATEVRGGLESTRRNQTFSEYKRFVTGGRVLQ